MYHAPRTLWLLAFCGCSGTSVPARLYVTSGIADRVYVLDAETGDILDRLAVDPRPGDVDEPHGIRLDPDGRHVYVTVSHGEPTVWKFEIPSHRLVGRVRLGMAGAGRIDVDSRHRGFVPDYYRDRAPGAGQLAIVDLADMEVLRRVSICAAPHDARVSPREDALAITCTQSDEIVLIDLETLEVTRRIPVQADSAADRPSIPLNVAWKPDGTRLYATLPGAGAVAEYTTDGVQTALVRVGADPAQLAIGPAGQLVVANRGDPSVSILQLAPLREIRRVPLTTPHPHGVALDPAGEYGYVTWEGTPEEPGGGGVMRLALPTGQLEWQTPLDTYILGVTYAVAY